MSKHKVPARRTKGMARKNALALFGVQRGKMETKEQRESTALILRLSSNEKIQALSRMMVMPQWKGVAMTTIMEKLQISYHALSTEYKELQKAEGFIRAANHLPEIMEQVALDAKSKTDECSTCGGSGEVEVYDYVAIDKAKGIVGNDVANERPSDPFVVMLANGKGKCGLCGGRGVVTTKADPDKLKLIFDTFGLTGKGGGLAVNLDLRKLQPQEDIGELAGSLGSILEGTEEGPAQ